jgi:hypothetical protein
MCWSMNNSECTVCLFCKILQTFFDAKYCIKSFLKTASWQTSFYLPWRCAWDVEKGRETSVCYKLVTWGTSGIQLFFLQCQGIQSIFTFWWLAGEFLLEKNLHAGDGGADAPVQLCTQLRATQPLTASCWCYGKLIVLGTCLGSVDDQIRYGKLFVLDQRVTKRRRLPLLRKAPSYMSPGGGGGLRGHSQWVQLCTEPK